MRPPEQPPAATPSAPGLPAQLDHWLRNDRLALVTVIDVLHPGRALLKLASRLRLAYHGHRITSVPRETLLADIADILATDPAERARLLAPLVHSLQAERADLDSLPPSDIPRWIAEPSDDSACLRRLLAAMSHPRPGIAQAAAAWWAMEKESMLDDATRPPDSQAALATAADALQRATQSCEQAGRSLRESARALEQAAQRAEQALSRHAARTRQQVDSVVADLARLRSWLGEQHAALRRDIGDLASAVRSLESRTDRLQAALHDLISRAASIAAALDRGQAELARRDLARLRSGRRRVGVFLDIANLFMSARESRGGRVSFRGVLERAMQLGDVVLARAYVSEGQNPTQHQGLETALREAGYAVRLLALRRHPDGRAKANWDLGMATDLMRSIDDLDVVVLGTGDGDFAELVRWLRERGLQVHIVGVPENTAQDLIASSDGWIPIEGDLLIT
jgi:uncharacterized LabA/DUF88 family protein